MLNHSYTSSSVVSFDLLRDSARRTRKSARTSSFKYLIKAATLLGCMYLIFSCAAACLDHHVFPLGALMAARAEEVLSAESLPSRGVKKSREERQRKAGEERLDYRNVPPLFWWTPDWVPDPEVDFAHVWSPWNSPWWPSLLACSGSNSADHVPNVSDPLGLVKDYSSDPIITQRFSSLLDQAVSRLVSSTSDAIYSELKTRKNTPRSTLVETPPPPIGVREPQRNIIAADDNNGDEEGSAERKTGHVIERERKERKATPAKKVVVQQNQQETIPIRPPYPQLHPIREAFNALFPTYVPLLSAGCSPHRDSFLPPHAAVSSSPPLSSTSPLLSNECSSLLLTPVDRSHWVLDVEKTVREQLDGLLFFANNTNKGNNKPTMVGEAPDNLSEGAKGGSGGGGGGTEPVQPEPAAVHDVPVVSGKARALSKGFPIIMGASPLDSSKAGLYSRRRREEDKVLGKEGKAARGGEKPKSAAAVTGIDIPTPRLGIGELWSSVIPTRLAIPYFGSFQPAASSSSATQKQGDSGSNSGVHDDQASSERGKNENNKIDLSTHGIHASDGIASFNSPFRNDMLMHYLHYSPATLEISSYTQLANIISAFSRDGGGVSPSVAEEEEEEEEKRRRGRQIGGGEARHEVAKKKKEEAEEDDYDDEKRETKEHAASPFDEVTNAIVTVINIPRGVSNATVTLLKELAMSHRRHYHQHAHVRDLNRDGSVGYGLGGGRVETQRLLFILREDMMPDARPLQWSVLDLSSSSLSSRPATTTTRKTRKYILPKRNQRVTVLDGEEAFLKIANEARYVQGDMKERETRRSVRKEKRNNGDFGVLGEDAGADANNQVQGQQKAVPAATPAQRDADNGSADNKDGASKHTKAKEQQNGRGRRDGPPTVSLWEFEVVRKAPPVSSVPRSRTRVERSVKATLSSDKGKSEKKQRQKNKKAKGEVEGGEEGTTKKTAQRSIIKEGEETLDSRAPRMSVPTRRRASPSAAAKVLLDITNARVLTLPMTIKHQQVTTGKKDGKRSKRGGKSSRTPHYEAADDERNSNFEASTEGDVLESSHKEPHPVVAVVDLTISPVVFHTMLHRLADYGSATQLLTRLTPQNFQRYYLWPSTSPMLIHHHSAAALPTIKTKVETAGGRGGGGGGVEEGTTKEAQRASRGEADKEMYLFGDGDAREHSMRVGKTRRLCRNALREYINKEERYAKEEHGEKMPQDEQEHDGKKRGVDFQNEKASMLLLRKRWRELSRLCFNGTIFAAVAEDSGGKCQSAMRAVARWHRLADEEQREQSGRDTRDRKENEKVRKILLRDTDILDNQEVLASDGHLMFSTVSLQTHDDKRFYRSLIRGATGMRGETKGGRRRASLLFGKGKGEEDEASSSFSSYRRVERSLWRVFEDPSPIPPPSSSSSPHPSSSVSALTRRGGGCRVLMIVPLMGTLKPLWYASPEALVTEGSRMMRRATTISTTSPIMRRKGERGMARGDDDTNGLPDQDEKKKGDNIAASVGRKSTLPRQSKSMMMMGSSALFSFPLFDLLDRDNVVAALSALRPQCARGMLPLMLEKSSLSSSSSPSFLLPPPSRVSPNTGRTALLLLRGKDASSLVSNDDTSSLTDTYKKDDMAESPSRDAEESFFSSSSPSSWWTYKEAVARLKQEALREEAREKAALRREAAASMALTPTVGFIAEKGPPYATFSSPPHHNLLDHPSTTTATNMMTMVMRTPLRMTGNRFYGVECAAALHVVVSPTSGCGALCQRISLVLIPQLADAMPWLRIHIYDRFFLLSEADGGGRGGGGRDHHDSVGGVPRRGRGRSTRQRSSSSLTNSRSQRKRPTRTTSTLRQKMLAEGERFVEPTPKCMPITNDDDATQCRDHSYVGNIDNNVNKCVERQEKKWVDSTPLLPPFATSSCTTHSLDPPSYQSEDSKHSSSLRVLQLPPLPYHYNHPPGKNRKTFSPLRKSSSPQKVLEDVMMRSMMRYLISKVAARKTEEGGGRIMVPALYLQVRNLTSPLFFSQSSSSSSEHERFDRDQKGSSTASSTSSPFYSNAANANHYGFTSHYVDDDDDKVDTLFLYHNKDFADIRSLIDFISEAMIIAGCPMPL